MNRVLIKTYSVNVSRKKLFTLIRAITNRESRRENHRLTLDLWTPVICIALERMGILGTESGIEVVSETPDQLLFKDRNPQLLRFIPNDYRQICAVNKKVNMVGFDLHLLPTRLLFMKILAQSVVERAEWILESAQNIKDERPQGGLVVSNYIARFIDDCCSANFSFKWPFSTVSPHWFAVELNAVDLIVIGAQFNSAADLVLNLALQRSLKDGFERLTETGLAKMH